MSADVFAIIVTIVFAAAGVAAAVLGWRRARSVRAVVRGLSTTFTVVGLWITGVLALLLGGVRAVIDWIAAQRLTAQMWTGIGVLAAGVVLYVVSTQLTPVTRAQARSHREELSGTERPAVSRPAGGAPVARPVPKESKKSRDTAVLGTEDDAEITQILRKHGIE
ncbi:MAG: hypothetical protein WAX29_12305 [Propionibacterium sp.]